MCCVKTDKPLEMPFGVQRPTGKGSFTRISHGIICDRSYWAGLATAPTFWPVGRGYLWPLNFYAPFKTSRNTLVQFYIVLHRY